MHVRKEFPGRLLYAIQISPQPPGIMIRSDRKVLRTGQRGWDALRIGIPLTHLLHQCHDSFYVSALLMLGHRNDRLGILDISEILQNFGLIAFAIRLELRLPGGGV